MEEAQWTEGGHALWMCLVSFSSASTLPRVDVYYYLLSSCSDMEFMGARLRYVTSTKRSQSQDYRICLTSFLDALDRVAIRTLSSFHNASVV
jgi:hypothetical protein